MKKSAVFAELRLAGEWLAFTGALAELEDHFGRITLALTNQIASLHNKVYVRITDVVTIRSDRK